MKEKIWKGFAIFGMISVAIFLIFLVISLLSLSRVGRVSISERISEAPTPISNLPALKTGQETGVQQSQETLSRLVIKTGTLNLVVKNINETAKKIIQYTEEKGGWVVNSSISQVKEVPLGTITVRIPTEVFDEAMDFSKKLAEKVSYEGSKAEDVTEEYVDLQSRLRNLEATEAQLLKIMERSGTIPDVLAVQRELNTVREQIETTKGRIQYLERSAKMASLTINLALSEELLPIPPAEKWRPKYVLLTTWKNVVSFWRGFSYFLIRVIVWAVVWIPFGVIIWLVKKFWKKRKEEKKI